MHDFYSFAVLGLLQGLTEFLPVSSSGHLILAREVFGFNPINGLAIDAVLQLATALAILVYFHKDILRLIGSFLNLVVGKHAEREDTTLILALIAGTLPAALLGFFLEDTMATVFRSATLVAYALIAGSFVMLAAEYVSKGAQKKNLAAKPTVWAGFIIGLFQSLALIPGMSRSGMTISGGLFFGLSRGAAARFGFLLATPIILGSGLKKLLDLGLSGVLGSIGPELLLGSIIAFASGIVAIHALLLFVRTQPLYVFIAYRLLLAGLIFVFL